MRQLSGMDASFVYLEAPRAPMHIGSVAIYDPSTAPGGKVTFKGILDHITGRMPLVPSYREKLARVPFDMDHPYWVDDPDFDLEFHVRHIALPKPGDWRQLCIQTARLHARALDLDRPLWEFYVIEGLDNVEGVPPGSFALVSKVHHAAIDGVSGAEMTAAIHDLTPETTDPGVPDTFAPGRTPSAMELLSRAGVNNAVQPLRFARLARRTGRQLLRNVGAMRGSVASAPRTRFSGVITPHRVVEGRSFDLTEMKRIKSAVPGATINDAVVAVVTGALRAYLESKGELPDVPMQAMAPISVRTEGESGTMGNQVSAMTVELPTTSIDPLDRLKTVHANTTRSKEMTNAIGARTLSDYSQFVPWALAGLATRTASRFSLANRTSMPINTVITNVPGPQMPLYMAGAEMVSLFGMGPVTDGMGIIHPVFSYNGKISISVTSCREMMPDPAFYAECLQASFDELSEATS
ncbi:MAG: diacylglycerol O-acyltransferase / wax synthase [Actinomycetota bacterium]|nr:diacylglycerol O-acyltransferase / wax synthase [Actinomycetota bacterium]